MTTSSPELLPEPITPSPPAWGGPVLMQQDWLDLTFVHWAVDPERVAPLFPRGVRPDVHEGATYVGLVPFRMHEAAPFRLPGVPWLGTFLETNVRLYSVDRHGVRGVVFLSLDCDRIVVTLGARAAFGTPYRWARMRHRRPTLGVRGEHTYEARLKRPWGPARSRVVVRVGEPRASTDLDHFVSARWGLHTSVLGLPLYVPNRHDPWPLHDAEVVDIEDELVASVLGDRVGDLVARPPDHVAFSPGVHTEFGLPRRLRPRRARR